MVRYLPSSATDTITISQLEYPTMLTCVCPDAATEKSPFPITGKLTFREGGVDYGLEGRPIALKYDGTSIGTVTTGTGGNYSTSIIIPTFGTYTITASYAGESGMTAAAATAGVRITGVGAWERFKTWWGSLPSWKKALIIAASIGGVVAGGAELTKK